MLGFTPTDAFWGYCRHTGSQKGGVKESQRRQACVCSRTPSQATKDTERGCVCVQSWCDHLRGRDHWRRLSCPQGVQLPHNLPRWPRCGQCGWARAPWASGHQPHPPSWRYQMPGCGPVTQAEGLGLPAWSGTHTVGTGRHCGVSQAGLGVPLHSGISIWLTGQHR